jgi:hypothetical protein
MPLSGKTFPPSHHYEIFSEGKKVGSMDLNFSEVTYRGNAVLKVEASTEIKVKKLFITLFSLESHEEALIDDGGTFHYSADTKIDGRIIQVTGHLENGGFHLKINEEEDQQTLIIKKNAYDMTSMDGPEDLLTEKKKEKKLRILDFDTLTVFEETLSWTHSQVVHVEGDTVKCKVVQFENPHEKGRRWISRNEPGLLIKEEGEDEDGPYAVRLVRKN